MMAARSGANVQGPLPGVSAALLSLSVFLQPCVESPRCVLTTADTCKECQTAAFQWLIRPCALMVRPPRGTTKQAGVSCVIENRTPPWADPCEALGKAAPSRHYNAKLLTWISSWGHTSEALSLCFCRQC